MAEKLQILLVSKDGKGGVVTHPAQFGYPEKKMVAERWFFNSGRFRNLNGTKSAVFTEQGFNLDINDFADEPTPDEAIDTAIANEAKEQLEEILGEDSIFTSMVVEWHNQHLNERITQ